MDELVIDNASTLCLPRVLEIYAIARNLMKECGNGTQWGKSYPERGIVCDDISRGHLYVVKDEDGIIRGVFAFFVGIDVTYGKIDGGKWHCDGEYGAIHRIASDGMRKGIFDVALAFCQDNAQYLRIDTHEKNKIMQHLVERNGFSRCGMIHVQDGTSRIAYDKIVKR